MIRYRLTLCALALYLPVLAGVGLIEHRSAVHCPTEDSCSIDYQHGHWTVTPIVP